MQADRLSLAAKALQPFIARIAPSDERARQAQAMLASWNAVMDKDRPEPLIFTAFMASLRRMLMEDKTGLNMEAKDPFAVKTLISLMTDHPSWCDAPDKPDPDCKRTLGAALDDGLALLVKREGADMSQWRWGQEHVSLLQHRVFSHVPLLDRVSDLSVPSSGGFYTLDRGGGAGDVKDKPFARTHGAGFRGLYDLADPEKSRFMITTGQSGHIFSPALRRPRALMERREVDPAHRVRGRSQEGRGEGTHPDAVARGRGHGIGRIPPARPIWTSRHARRRGRT